MSFVEPLGYSDEFRAKRQAVMANAPASARRRIMGWPRVWRPEKSHRIEVDCKTGARTVHQHVPPPPPAPQPVRRIWKVKAKVVQPPPAVLHVLYAVADAYGFSPGIIQAYGRKLPLVRARFAWVKLLRDAGYSYAAIGRGIHRDHSSCMHACDRAADLMAESADYRNRYEAAHIALAGGVC